MNSKANSKTYLTIVLALLMSVAGTANADFIFGIPENLGPTVNSSGIDGDPSVSADGLVLLFSSDRSGGYGSWDIWMSTRPTEYDAWGEPVNLGSQINGSKGEQSPNISPDGLTLYFSSTRSGGFGSWDLWVTSRQTTEDNWSLPQNLGSTVNSSVLDHSPSISSDGLSLFFGSLRPGGSGGADLWLTTRDSIHDDWGEPVNLGPVVNSTGNDGVSNISPDGRFLFFSAFAFGSPRPDGYGGADLWVTARPTTSDPWDVPVNLGPIVNSPGIDTAPSISADCSTLYFGSNRSGGVGVASIYQVSIEPVVDLNGDGIVDAADMCIIVDFWGTDEPLCDIGPMPWGDGIVDVQDLIVLAEHLFEEFPPVE